ncbi:hypothetical protein HN51_042964 [Arachis hypogaea]|uniref:NET domain-containing protein n=1 Tax=Arachis hypogaea TaxID=3818 RepID=A0A444Y7T2_ARAHY|nr:Transcription factor [Arachis hypogaea]RYQ97973.1 hypothetical protein Ahy_B08g094047 [Arachis hypogaea]
MLEAQPVLFRRIPLRRRMLRPSVGTEDRGWTSLHVCARKGDLKLGEGPNKAKDPNKREMSLEEKHKLGIGLQSLPPEKMEQVIQIIRNRNGNLKQDEDEIELDIEAVDTETL